MPLLSKTVNDNCWVAPTAAGDGLKTVVLLLPAPVIAMLATGHSWKGTAALFTGLVVFTLAVTVVKPGITAKALLVEPNPELSGGVVVVIVPIELSPIVQVKLPT